MYDDSDNPPRGPVLYTHPEAWAIMTGLVRICPVEVNGWGLIRRESANRLVLASPGDVFITDQVASVGSVDVTSSTTALALDWADRMDRGHEMRLQFHGHPAKAYFSSIDMANIEGYSNGGQWMASIVFDRSGGYVARLDTFVPMRAWCNLEIRPLDVYDVDGHCRDLLKQHVRREVRVGPYVAGQRQKTRVIGVFDPLPPGARD